MYILKQLKKDMEFNEEISGIIEVFKNIAVSEFRRLQSERKRDEEFLNAWQTIIKNIDRVKYSKSPFLKGDERKSSLFVAFTSDEGFSGGLNAMILEKALGLRNKENDEFIILGERGARGMEERGESFICFEGIDNNLDFSQVKKLTNYLVAEFLKGRWGRVSFVYSRFISIAQQEITDYELLPFRFESNGREHDNSGGLEQEVLFEPSIERVVDYLVKVWICSQVHEIFWHSKLSEWAARIIHLESSGQTLAEWHKELKYRYLKNMHELSDRSIREVFSARISGT